MENQSIAIIVITIIVVAALVLYVIMHIREPQWVEQEYNPKVNGITSNPHSCYYHRRLNHFCITLENGSQVIWGTSPGNTAYDELLNLFREDIESGRNIFPENQRENFLELCYKLEHEGWPAWDLEEELLDFHKMSIAIEKNTKYDYNKAKHLAKKMHEHDLKVSSCCKVALLHFKVNGANQCSKCKKFCKTEII